METPNQPKPWLNLVVLGHVDHGKSTLIGRLLLETRALAKEQLDEIRRAGLETAGQVELAFATDQLREERRGLMTIDTAQVRFATAAREYVVIDAPGHREFLRHMVTGASQADAAVLVVDATEGVGEQTRRHGYVAAMLGLRQVVVAINKMDLVGWRGERFEQVRDELAAFLARLGIEPRRWVPISARDGDNVVRRTHQAGWHAGPTLLEAMEELPLPRSREDMPLRLPVQDRYEIDGRVVHVGRIAAGEIHAGGQIVFVPSGRRATVASVEVFMQERSSAGCGESIGFTIDPPAEGNLRGEVACPADAPVPSGKRFRASVFWLGATPLEISQPLRLRLATQEVPCRIERIEQVIDSSTLEVLGEDAPGLSHAQAGHVLIATERAIAAAPFAGLAELGRFVLARDEDAEAGGIVSDILQE